MGTRLDVWGAVPDYKYGRNKSESEFPYRCQVKMGTPPNGDPGPHFHMKLGTRVPNFLIFWGPLGPQFHMVLGTLP